MTAFSARMLHIISPEDARRELKCIGVDPAGIRMMSSKMVTRCIKINDLQCRQANILKQEMLSLGGDAAVARGTVACSIDKTDVILMGTEKQLRKLCDKLAPQPFGLSGLATQLTDLLGFNRNLPEIWSTSRRELSLKRPLIMGILNVTPDSFSDGNRFYEPHRAIEKALEMSDEGADIIDIGGESTRPGAAALSSDPEMKRVLPVINALSGKISCALSIDTWKSDVAREALAAGAEIINDISGFTFDPAMADVAVTSRAGVVLMHTRGTPQNMQQNTSYKNLMDEVVDSLRSSITCAVNAGVKREKIAIDPGIGFAKTIDQNLEILRRLEEFTSFGVPILIGTSRKSFIGQILDKNCDERLYGTAATVALAVANGANILRVHDVRQMRDVVNIAHAVSAQTSQ